MNPSTIYVLDILVKFFLENILDPASLPKISGNFFYF
jgi:hypothetical protein